MSDGTITVRDQANQQQDIAQLSRDTDNGNGSIGPIFDKEKEQNRLKAAQLIGEIGAQVSDIARTQGKIAEEKALRDPKAIQAAKEALAKNGNLMPTDKQVTDQVRSTASASYGTGSDLQRAIQAATAITQGLSGGNIGQALANGSAPYLAHEISKYLPAEQNQGANLMAHAVLGAAVGHFNGNATVGAVSAFTAEAAAPAIIKAMGWDKDSLTEKQKQTVSALATLAAGLAGGLVGDSSSSAVAGAQAGKNAVENNALSDIVQAQSEGKTLEQKASEYVEAENERYKKANCGGMSAEACSVKMYTERREALKDMVSTGADFVPVVGTIKSAVEAQSALDYLNVAASLISGERVAAGVLKAAEKALAKGDVAEASKLINKASDEIATGSRPSHRQSEIDVGKDLGDGWREQVSFKDGKEVPYGTKGGVRPDWCQGNVCSVEVKNYNITTNQSGLINNVSKQAIQRAENLPAGMRQEVVIDIRGQKVTSIQEDAIIKGIVQKSNGTIKPTDIQFKR